ncbi:MAG: hypothetical protein SVO26_07765 [Chloroflexota bacterium]|nr:hypothetical protein [Chloroflexota bacterium]
MEQTVLEQIRDIMIIISSLLVIGATLTITVLVVMVYRKLSPTLDSAQGFFADLKGVSSLVNDRVAKPLTKGAIFAAGVRQALKTLSKRSEMKEDNNGDRK